MLCQTDEYLHVSSELKKSNKKNCKITEVLPGSILKVTKEKITKFIVNTVEIKQKPNLHFCSFEMIYFMDADSIIGNRTVEIFVLS